MSSKVNAKNVLLHIMFMHFEYFFILVVVEVVVIGVIWDGDFPRAQTIEMVAMCCDRQILIK